jgi:hypothetical protein
MDSSLSKFVSQFLGVVLATLVPVILMAFVSIPYSLGGHPGDVRTAESRTSQHMT